MDFLEFWKSGFWTWKMPHVAYVWSGTRQGFTIFDDTVDKFQPETINFQDF